MISVLPCLCDNSQSSEPIVYSAMAEILDHSLSTKIDFPSVCCLLAQVRLPSLTRFRTFSTSLEWTSTAKTQQVPYLPVRSAHLNQTHFSRKCRNGNFGLNQFHNGRMRGGWGGAESPANAKM